MHYIYLQGSFYLSVFKRLFIYDTYKSHHLSYKVLSVRVFQVVPGKSFTRRIFFVVTTRLEIGFHI